MKKKIVIAFLTILVILASVKLYQAQQTSWNDKFKATGNDWQSPKRIEDYFVDSLRMTPDEAKIANNGASFYITENSSLNGIISNLTYYGLVRDSGVLKYALEHTKDNVLGRDGAIKVGKDGSIDLAYYDLSREMDTWQIADTLLNKPHYRSGDPYNYLFMPGDPNAPYGPRSQE
jgi:hypothetical protein